MGGIGVWDRGGASTLDRALAESDKSSKVKFLED